ncbi:hypothetical protein PIB30_089481 [Stylosanthes scabra]|uniref:RNase H type-1 domain-containing protein n=1 Tax=Stylosanthes scabra TaxID=79078 RepID=A0ABU6XT23_9FABA|nr:hypothetical protein [Stylosanthes scabra]
MSSVLRAELFAIWRGLLLAWECGFKDVICETDCLDAFLATRMMDPSRSDANRDLFSKIFELALLEAMSKHHFPMPEALKDRLVQPCELDEYCEL